MNFFEWNQQLSVDNPLIDADHQTLISLVNEFEMSHRSGMTPPSLSKFWQLIDYTSTHFEREESLMGEILPRSKNIRTQHEKTVSSGQRSSKELQQGRISIAIETAELLRFG